jgi:hypothetical protein
VTSAPTYAGDTNKPTRNPTIHPSFQPTCTPSGEPSNTPTEIPTSAPSRIPYFIDVLRVDTTETELLIAANVTEESILQCAVYQDPDFPTSINSVIFQNYKTISVNKYALLVIPNLAAGVEYRLYCITRDFDNIISMSYGRLLETVVTVQTKGARKLFVDLSSTVVPSTTQSYNVLTMHWQKLPSDDLTIMLNTVYGENVTVDSNNDDATELNSTSVFEPKMFHFDGSLKYAFLKASLPSNLDLGKYTLNFVLAGALSSKYEIVYGSSQFLVADDHVPAAPMLREVIFSDDGSFIIAKFNMKTDRAGLTTHFTCSLLFSFDFAQKVSCIWSGTSRVHIYLAPATTTVETESSLTVGSEVILLPNKLRAECKDVNVAECRQWSAASWQNLSVSSPENSIEPTLFITAPSVISACSGFILDLTNSEGSGGRAWDEVSIVVQSDNSHTQGILNNYYAETYKIFPPSPVSKNFFSPGYNYTFSIYICNFLKKCSSVTTHALRVISGDIPNVSISGVKSRSVFRRGRLELTANAFTAFCGQSTSTKFLEYRWSIFVDGGATNVTSISKQPSQFILPGYSLTPQSLYNVSVTVYSSISGLSATSVVDIFVDQADVKAVVAGGSVQSLNAGSSIVLDASSSYDDDIDGVTGLDAGLNYQWSCLLVQPVVDASACGVELMFNGSGNEEYVTIIASKAQYEYTTSAISVVVFKDNRLDEFVVNINVLGASSPIITIEKLTSRFSASDRLKLVGSVELFSTEDVSWSVDDPSVDFYDVALTPFQLLLPASKHSMNLVLKPQSLAAAASYSFSLQSRQTVATLEVDVAGAPYGGQVRSDPDDGVEYFTSFNIAAEGWTAAALPLKYEFGFLAMDDSYLPLERKSEITSVRSNFARGNPLDRDRVTVVLIVFNSLDGKTIFHKKLVVSPSTTTLYETSESISTILRSLNGETNLGSIKRVVSVYTAPLNAVDCTSAPDCVPLQRASCATVDNTCGSCVQGYFGEEDSNEPCYLIDTQFPTQAPSSRPSDTPTSTPSSDPSGMPSGQPSGQPTQPTGQPTSQITGQPTSQLTGQPTSQLTGQPTSQLTGQPSITPSSSRRLDGIDLSLNCTSNDQCEKKFESCDLVTSTCNTTQKKCHHDCSGRGSCFFQDVSTGGDVNSCSAQDVRCAAVCRCGDMFAGQYCSMNKTFVEAKTTSRLNLISALESTMLVDNQDMRSTETLLSTLFNLGKNRYELNQTSCTVIFKIIEMSLALSKDYELPFESIEGAMYVLNECGYIFGESAEPILAGNRAVRINEFIGLMIDMYSEVVFQDLLFGEEDVQLNYPLFKVVNAVRLNTDSSPIVLSAAETLSRRYGTDISSVSISIDKTFSKLQVSMYESAKRFTHHNILSNPLHLSIAFGQMDALRAAGEEISGVAVFTLQNNYPSVFGREFVKKNVTFRTYCNDTVNRVRHYTCPTGFNITHRCDGRVGVITSSCPKTTWQPKCSLIDGSSLYTSERVTQCKRLSYSSTSTVCECLLPNFNIHSKERTLEVTTIGAFLPDDDEALVITFDEDSNFVDIVDSDSLVTYSLVSVLWGIAFIIFMIFLFNMQTQISFAKKNKVETEQVKEECVMTPVSDQEKVQSMSKVLREVFPPESFYPRVHSLRRVGKVLLAEHLYTSLYFKNDKENWNVFTRMTFALRLITNITFLLFAVALILGLQFPNDPSICTSKLNEGECLSENNVFDTDQNLCSWYLSRRMNGADLYVCEYKDVQLTAWGAWLMVLLVSCLMLPVNAFLDYFFGFFVLVPTQNKPEGPQMSMRQKLVSLLCQSKGNNVAPQAMTGSSNIEENSMEFGVMEDEGRGGGGGGEEEGSDDIDIENNSSEDPRLYSLQEVKDIKRSMEDLVAKVKLQRHYVAIEDAEMFDKNWRWNAAEGNFMTAEGAMSGDGGINRSQQQVGAAPPLIESGRAIVPFNNLNYLQTQEEIVETLYLSKLFHNFLRGSNDEEFRRVLLHCFVMDYLGRNNIAAKVFIAREDSIFNPRQPLEMFHKVVAIFLILAVNSAFLCFVMLQNGEREKSYQTSFLVLYLIQFSMEFVYYEAMICMWMFYVIPSTISREVQSAVSTLQENISKAFLQRAEVSVLNAAKWFFVSTKLAESSPHLLESQVVLAYQTQYRPIDKDTLATSFPLHNEYYYTFTFASRGLALLKLIGTGPKEWQRSALYLLQVAAAFCLFALALLVRSQPLWVLVVVFLALYEGVMWSVFARQKHVVYSEEGVIEPHSVDYDDLEDLSSSSASGEVDLGDEEEEEEVMEEGDEYKDDGPDLQSDLNDLVLLEQNINEAFNITLKEMMARVDERKSRVEDEDSGYKEDQMRLVDKAAEERSALSINIESDLLHEIGKSNKNDTSVSQYSMINEPNPVLAFSPSLSLASNSFVEAKKSRAQPPKKIVADNLFELSSDSSSDDNESVGQLNDIFERFLSTGRSIHHVDNDGSHDVVDDDDDDDSMQDYDRLMTTFNFRNMDDEDDGSESDIY